MFTGDAEEPAETSMLPSSIFSAKCDILKVGHHGSYTATSLTFLGFTNSTYAIISAGLDNQYDHPHNQTLEKMYTKNVTTYSTIDSGTIIVQTNQITITFLSNPMPIVPEIPQNLIVVMFATTLIGALIFRRKLTKNNSKL